MKRGRILTLGYQQRSVEQYIAELDAADVRVLVDVRQTAWSHRPDFSKPRLSATLRDYGIHYYHASFAGNPVELRRNASSHDECLSAYLLHLQDNPDVIHTLDVMLQEVMAGGQNVCLMCYERHAADCHRSVLLQEWAVLMGARASIVHLGIEGAPRFSSRSLDRRGFPAS